MKKEHTVNKAGYKTAVLTCDIGGATVRLIKSCKNSFCLHQDERYCFY